MFGQLRRLTRNPDTWNEFITELVKAYLPAGSGLIGLFVYAVVITVMAVMVITWLGRMAERTGGKPGI